MHREGAHCLCFLWQLYFGEYFGIPAETGGRGQEEKPEAAHWPIFPPLTFTKVLRPFLNKFLDMTCVRCVFLSSPTIAGAAADGRKELPCESLGHVK